MKINHDTALTDGLELFRQSKWHKNYNVEDVYRYLIAPLKYNRIRLYYQYKKPIGLVTWCWLSQENGKKFLNNNYYITKDDYVSDTGEELWGIELIAPYGDVRQVVNLTRKEHADVYKRNETIHWRRLHEPNKRHTRELKT
tara:strand:- start:4520 stop:4942 length:423 start_codon:yes stop_codon:yes gene_type:complete